MCLRCFTARRFQTEATRILEHRCGHLGGKHGVKRRPTVVCCEVPSLSSGADREHSSSSGPWMNGGLWITHVNSGHMGVDACVLAHMSAGCAPRVQCGAGTGQAGYEGGLTPCSAVQNRGLAEGQYFSRAACCRLNMPTALTGDLSSAPGTNIRQLIATCKSSARGSNTLFWIL